MESLPTEEKFNDMSTSLDEALPQEEIDISKDEINIIDISKDESNIIDISKDESNIIDISKDESNIDISKDSNVIDISKDSNIIDISKDENNIDISKDENNIDISEDSNIMDISKDESNVIDISKDEGSILNSDIVIIEETIEQDEKFVSNLTLTENVLAEITQIEPRAETIELEVDKDANENIVEELDIVYDNCQNNVYEIEYDFSHIPHQITGSWKEFTSATRHNFTRGCKWAPDGSCILTCSDDNILRIFNLPEQLWDSSQWSDITEMEAVVKISEGELIYDYCWYPLMNSSDASTCCLVSTSRNSTVHLWDGFTGELRCTYRTFNHMDEITTPHSLSFDADGQKLFCGFEKVVRIFNVDTPGRNCEERRVFAKKSGQPGIISCFAFTAANKNISAAGSYQRTIGIYSEPSGELECLLEGQKGGVTQLQFSPDGTYLYSGGRKDPEILCWDMRNLGTVLFSLRRTCVTNQRMYFDISRCGRYIVSGNQNGVVTFWDVNEEPKVINEDEFSVMKPIQFFLAHDDCVNGVSLHPTYPLLCSSSGQRKFPTLLGDEDEEMFSRKIGKWDNSLRLWWIGKCS